MIAAVLCLSGGFRAERTGAQAAGAMIAVTSSYGIGNQGRYGRCLPVYTVLTNYGSAFEGTLTVSISTGGEDAIITEHSVRLDAESSEEYMISLGAYTKLGEITIEVADSEGTVISGDAITPDIWNYGNNYVIGVWAAEGNYDYLEYLGGKVIYLEEETLPEESCAYELLDMLILDGVNSNELDERKAEAIVDFVYAGGTLVFGTGANELEAYEGFAEAFGEAECRGVSEESRDHGLNRSEVKEELCTAIIDFEEERESTITEILAIAESSIRQSKADGNLAENFDVISAADSAGGYVEYQVQNKATQSEGLNDSMEDAGESDDGQYSEQVLYDNYIAASALAGRDVETLAAEPILQATAEIIYEGASQIACRDGHPMLYRKECGDGTVLLWTTGLNAEEGVDTSENLFWYAQARLLKQHINEARREKVESEMYGTALDYRLVDTVGYLDESRIPRIGRYAAVLCVYVLVVGPILYLLLRKKDRSIHIWWLVPLTAVVFTVIVYAMGSTTRISRPYVDYINVLQYDKSGLGRGSVYFSVTVPSSEEETLVLKQGTELIEIRNGDIPNYYIGYGYFSDEKEYPVTQTYQNTVIYDEESTAVNLKMYPAFTRAYYRADYKAEKVDTDGQTQELSDDTVRISKEGPTGTVYNHTEFNLTDVLFIGDQFLCDIGDLESGASAEILAEKTEFLATRDMLWENPVTERLSEEAEENPGGYEAKKLNLFQYFLEQQVYREGQSWLIGFTEELGDENPLSGSISEQSGDGITMVTIPAAVSYTQDGIEYVPLMDAYMNVLEGSYDNSYFYRFLDEELLRVEYRLPEEDEVTSILYTGIMNPKYSKDSFRGFEGDVYFLNRITGRYDLVFEKNEPGAVTNPEAYLDEDNVLVVEFRRSYVYANRYMTLPYLSYEKEAE